MRRASQFRKCTALDDQARTTPPYGVFRGPSRCAPASVPWAPRPLPSRAERHAQGARTPTETSARTARKEPSRPTANDDTGPPRVTRCRRGSGRTEPAWTISRSRSAPFSRRVPNPPNSCDHEPKLPPARETIVVAQQDSRAGAGPNTAHRGDAKHLDSSAKIESWLHREHSPTRTLEVHACPRESARSPNRRRSPWTPRPRRSKPPGDP